MKTKESFCGVCDGKVKFILRKYSGGAFDPKNAYLINADDGNPTRFAGGFSADEMVWVDETKNHFMKPTTEELKKLD